MRKSGIKRKRSYQHDKYICVPCRRVFKDVRICTYCHNELITVNRNFRAPKINNTKEWEKVKMLLSIDKYLHFPKKTKIKTLSQFKETINKIRTVKIKGDIDNFRWQCKHLNPVKPNAHTHDVKGKKLKVGDWIEVLDGNSLIIKVQALELDHIECTQSYILQNIPFRILTKEETLMHILYLYDDSGN